MSFKKLIHVREWCLLAQLWMYITKSKNVTQCYDSERAAAVAAAAVASVVAAYVVAASVVAAAAVVAVRFSWRPVVYIHCMHCTYTLGRPQGQFAKGPLRSACSHVTAALFVVPGRVGNSLPGGRRAKGAGPP
eukprot:GHVT01089293.1.p1 GENE.GHVT01089293.1~~GHVT01089293.1.p1  ORF type:complete len:133 (+),score=15.99 GHVT01089293.1:1086-1484(+)